MRHKSSGSGELSPLQPCPGSGGWCRSLLGCQELTQLLSLAEEADSHFQPEWQPGSSGSYLENSWEEQLLEQQDHLEKEMEEAKKMISGLQVRDFSPQRAFPSRVTQHCTSHSVNWAEPSYLAQILYLWDLSLVAPQPREQSPRSIW